MSAADDQSWWAGVPYLGNGYSIGRHATQPEYSANSFLFINESGNVGIGTASPNYGLEIISNAGLRVSGVNTKRLYGNYQQRWEWHLITRAVDPGR